MVATKNLLRLKKEKYFKILSKQHELFSVYYPDSGNNFLIKLNAEYVKNYEGKLGGNLNLCEIYSRKLYDETGIETVPGTEYGNYPNHVVMNINNNKFDVEQVNALTRFNNKFLEINYNRFKDKRSPFENLENRLML